MNKQFSTIVTRKGQITIPAEVRQLMGLVEGTRVAILLDDNRQVCLSRTESVVSRTAGLLKTEGVPLSAEELREAGEQAIADATGERDKG